MTVLLPVVNQKGGCGKTTTAMNLAGGLQKAGYRVAVVDADPQASATKWSIAKGSQHLPFDVVPARLVRRLDETAFPDYEVVIVDCPPGLVDEANPNSFAHKAIRAAEAVLVPIQPSPTDFAAAATLVRYLEDTLTPDQKVMVLINRAKHNLIGKSAPAQARVLFTPIPQAQILHCIIGDRTPITEVSGSGRTVYDYAPGSSAAREYTELTKEVIACLSTTAPA